MVPSSRCHPHAAILKLPSSRCLPQVAVLSLVALPSSRRLLCDAVFFAMPPSRCALVMPPLRCRPYDAALTRAMPPPDAVRRCREGGLFVRMPARLRARACACQRFCSSACQRVRVLARSPARPLLLQLYSCSPDASVSRAHKPCAAACGNGSGSSDCN